MDQKEWLDFRERVAFYQDGQQLMHKFGCEFWQKSKGSKCKIKCPFFVQYKQILPPELGRVKGQRFVKGLVTYRERQFVLDEFNFVHNHKTAVVGTKSTEIFFHKV